ncbi:hypothetical protein [Oceanobacillus jeddahense]|uniref:LPXTG cell wall anchor domain-containing protein n=1 Tax=Oceanobacillus jeddahense TaxID=1462527 RepID=A0ABY5JU64_9BACI|nr:hypothetical protein [Oceanobacillus jeddahense]UUI02109.1 hypothetical protein NP439_19000 [Oceanobacillus jeddahense]
MRFKQKVGFLLVIGTLLLVSPLGAMKVVAIADFDGSVDNEEVEENLELPDIHENTIIYNGTINPKFMLRVEVPGLENVVSPYVSEDGQFSMEILMADLEAGDEIVFRFGEDGKEPQERTIEVQPEEEGKEVVESSADTSAVEEVIEEGTSVDWPDSNDSIRFDLSTIGDVDGQIYYAREGKTINENTQMEHMDSTSYTALLAPSEEVYEEQMDADEFDYPQPGEKVNIYITALGVTAAIETEVPEDLNVWNEDDDQENGTESDEDQNESDNDGSSEDTENNGATENNDSNDNGTDEAAENTDYNDNADETVDGEKTESAVSDSNTSGGFMSPIGWTVIGMVILALVIGGIIWSKKRRNV